MPEGEAPSIHQIGAQTNFSNGEFKQKILPMIPNSSNLSICVKKTKAHVNRFQVCSDLIKLSKTKIFPRAYLPFLWKVRLQLSTKTMELELSRRNHKIHK